VVLDKFGNRSKSVARVQFKITPAYYKTVWFWALIIALILAAGFYIIRNRFLRQQRQYQKEQSLNNKIIELEQQALKAQMNPHFIFNCLTAVQHFVNREDLYSANMYLSNFAKLIRKTLDLSGEQYISLDKEVAYLQNYVQLEKMRFQEKFQYTIDVAEDIDQYSVQIPPMLLQPIIENAIRHGLRNKETDTGLLKITFTQRGDKIICTIDDNGVGMKKAKELKTTMHVEYQSKGMSLTQSRIQAINMISDKKITIEIKDKYDNNEAAGTLFILTFEQ
jgi:LytS/YehU family sensor histidine kinase